MCVHIRVSGVSSSMCDERLRRLRGREVCSGKRDVIRVGIRELERFDVYERETLIQAPTHPATALGWTWSSRCDTAARAAPPAPS